VRNPWDRAVRYHAWLRDQDFAHPAVDLARRLDFGDFVTHPQTRAAFARSPARSYFRQRDGAELPGLCIRLEHFAQDADPLFRHLGFEILLPQENRSQREPDWRGYFDAAARQAIADSCAEDIARFGYSFDG
jgi:hypothetical protein